MSKLRDEILAHHAPSVRRRAELEYDVISAVIRECDKAGFSLDSIDYGDEEESIRTREAALKLIFNLDECNVYFRRANLPKDRRWVYLVMGNSGWDVVSDYSWDGGDSAMEPQPGTFAHAIETATQPFADKYG